MDLVNTVTVLSALYSANLVFTTGFKVTRRYISRRGNGYYSSAWSSLEKVSHCVKHTLREMVNRESRLDNQGIMKHKEPYISAAVLETLEIAGYLLYSHFS